MKRASGSYAGLTVKQAEMLSFLRKERDANRTPSFEEMRAALGLASKSGVHRLLEALVERGYVDRTYNRARALRVYDVSSYERVVAQPGPGTIRTPTFDITTVPMAALLNEIARRTRLRLHLEDSHLR